VPQRTLPHGVRLMGEPLIGLHNVTIGYGRKAVLSRVNWCIEAGDFVGLVGPNGSGKTTLLRGLLGVLKPQHGEICRFAPHPAVPLVCGYVPQEKTVEQLFPLSVADVVLMGRMPRLRPGRRPGAADRRVVLRSLGHVGLAQQAAAPFQELSGGQKQRVLMARALATEPHMLVLDEPTSGMDLASEKQLMALITDLHVQQRLTVILATHNLNLVAQYARQLALVTDGGLLVGEVSTLLSAQRLRDVYHIEVTVQEVNGRRFIY
jgi:manganese/iron transport system ATP-binding protein